jgi:hypothetical protein
MIFRRRFGELIDRQLDLFERENNELFERVADAEDDYRRATRDDAEERFGDLQDVLTEGTDALAELREAYAETLDGDTAVEYTAAFNFAVLRRFPQFALELDDEGDDEDDEDD